MGINNETIEHTELFSFLTPYAVSYHCGQEGKRERPGGKQTRGRR